MTEQPMSADCPDPECDGTVFDDPTAGWECDTCGTQWTDEAVEEADPTL